MNIATKPFQPRSHVAISLLVIDLQLDIQIARDGLQHKVKNANIFKCDPLNIGQFVYDFNAVFTINL